MYGSHLGVVDVVGRSLVFLRAGCDTPVGALEILSEASSDVKAGGTPARTGPAGDN